MGARLDRRRGSQLVEAGLMMTPFLALAFLTLDAGWAIFIKATLQHAVHEGVRYAVTSQVSAGNGQIDSIKAVVQNQAMGLLSGTQAGTISVVFLDPVSLAPVASNVGGNIVQVSVVNYQLAPVAPLLRSSNSVPITVVAADRLEGSPGGAPPAL